MIRKMASKLHLRTHDSSSSSSAASSSYTQSTLSHEHRASISTARTSLHEWVKTQQSEAAQQARPMQVDEASVQARRAKGSYRLSDFIIQRTLGTGSFGRVHLGKPRPSLFPLPIYRSVPWCGVGAPLRLLQRSYACCTQSAVNTTSDSTLSKY